MIDVGISLGLIVGFTIGSVATSIYDRRKYYPLLAFYKAMANYNKLKVETK
jgi:hypothetical protein